jgi:hypothetical protein
MRLRGEDILTRLPWLSLVCLSSLAAYFAPKDLKVVYRVRGRVVCWCCEVARSWEAVRLGNDGSRGTPYREFIGPVRDPESAVPSVKGECSFFIPLDQT